MDQPGPGGRGGDLIGKRAADYPAPRATDIEVAVDAPELLSAVDLAGDFLPAHIIGTAVAPEGAPTPLLAVTPNGVVGAITRPYPFRAFGRYDVWEAIIDPLLLRPGANAVGVFAVRERADGTVVLAEAYAAAARPAINLVREEATELWDVTAVGLHATKWSEGRAFRWTTGAARITVPIDPQAPPAELVVDVLMTGQPKGLRIESSVPRSLRRRRFAARNGSSAHDLSHVSGQRRRSAARGRFSVVGGQRAKFGPRGPQGPPETATRVDLSPLRAS